jgi:hypothetical protein
VGSGLKKFLRTRKFEELTMEWSMDFVESAGMAMAGQGRAEQKGDVKIEDV